MESDKHMCDVCRYVDGDTTKKDSYYCPKCNAWICGKCEDKYFRRAFAMCIRWLDQDVKIM